MEWLILILLAANLALIAFLVFRKPGARDGSCAMLMLRHQMQGLRA
ncbi:hypothetical protein HZC00_03835 [Candidatus Kaiserbacteria bacterium]|nr:hypothetical protein [Candidatus Kaiserbacteria bacterium]